MHNQAVHPRVCREQFNRCGHCFFSFGSSPRVRGTDRSKFDQLHQSWFIPACAGNSLQDRSRLVFAPVHPRVCGEQSAAPTAIAAPDGSSPRVRGTAFDCHEIAECCRFIPACAGNRRHGERSLDIRSVHPRVCGEQLCEAGFTRPPGGSSPRVRGTVCVRDSSRSTPRFIPACAGNRTSVEHCLAGITGSSPRVRGTVCVRDSSRSTPRFIPACAGNRTSVEHCLAGITGSSPRVRGPDDLHSL